MKNQILRWTIPATLALACACEGYMPAQTSTPGSGDPGASAAPAADAPQKQLLLGRYRMTGDPATGSWDLARMPIDAETLPEGVSRRTAALADGDEAVEVPFGAGGFAMANCVNGTCGCNGGSPDYDVPAWYSGTCVSGQRVAFGKVQLTNNTADEFFQNPAAVFVPVQPSSLAFFSTFPAPPFDCNSFLTQTRSVAPYNGEVYVRYNDIAAGSCEKGVDHWIAAATDIGDVNELVLFDIYVLVDSILPTQVPNGDFENGLANWTINGQANTTPEHCSHVGDFTCGPTENGVFPPAAAGNMARVTTVDGSAVPAYSGSIQSTAFSLPSAMPNLQYRLKAGSREAAAFCLAAQNDEFYVEARANGGAWVTLPLPDPPDVASDNDDRLGTGDTSIPSNDDCASFNQINLAAVLENSWYPGTPVSPQDWSTITVDLTAAPLSASTNDLIEVRFNLVSGAPPQLGVSVMLLDDVQLVP